MKNTRQIRIISPITRNRHVKRAAGKTSREAYLSNRRAMKAGCKGCRGRAISK